MKQSNMASLNSELQKFPLNDSNPVPRLTLVWTLGVLFALVAMSSYFSLASVPFNRLDATQVTDVIYNETTTPNLDTYVNEFGNTVTLPYGRYYESCCSNPYAVYSAPIPEDFKVREDPAILVPYVLGNMAVYIDGEWVAGEGRFGANPSRFGQKALLLRLPPQHVKQGQTLDIIVARRAAQKILYPPLLSEHEILRKVQQRLHLTRYYLPLIHVIISLFVALLCASAASIFRAKSVLYALSVFMAGWAIITAGEITSVPDISERTLRMVFYPAFWATLLALICFVSEWTSVFENDQPKKSATKSRFAWLGKPVPLTWRRRLNMSAFVIFIIMATYSAHTVYRLGFAGSDKINRQVTTVALLLMPLIALRLIAYYTPRFRSSYLEIFAFLFIISAVMIDMILLRVFRTIGLFIYTASLFFPFILLVSLARRGQGVLAMAMMKNEELTERVTQAEARIRQEQEKLRRQEKQAALMSERARIMRDMHDGVGGHLVSLMASVRQPNLDRDYLEDEIQHALDDLRLIIDSLDNVGTSLDTALAIFQERARSRLEMHNIEFEWDNQLDEPAEGFRPRTIIQIYRILQEALTNIQKHSQATHASISIRRDNHLTHPLILTVSDNGIGWDGISSAGRGLASMQHRAENIDAELAIKASEEGTNLELRLPDPVKHIGARS